MKTAIISIIDVSLSITICLRMSFALNFLCILAFHLTWFTSVLATTNPCYFPDGNIAPEFVPCSPNGDGDCCVNGDFCTQWGYCISDSKGYHYRGACTDTAWNNPSCPKYCLADTNSGNSTSVNVIACNVASDSGTWCCAYDGNCCSASTFVPSFGTIFAEPGASTAAASTGTASIPSLGLSPSATSSSGIASSPPSTGASASSTATGAAASSTQTPGSLVPKSTVNTGTIVGAILSVVLGLAAIAGFGLFAVERKKRIRLEAERPGQTQPEMKPEASQVSEQKVMDIHHVSAVNKWSPSDISRPRHELSTQSYAPSELPTGSYGR